MPATKRYPWKCAKCRERSVCPAVIEYRATVEHDGRQYEIHIPHFDVPKCQSCGALVMTDAANQQITEALRQSAKLLGPEAIREGRKRLGYNQQEFADILGVAVATVSRWETGAQIQSYFYDGILRAFLALPDLRQFLAELHGVSFVPAGVVSGNAIYISGSGSLLVKSSFVAPALQANFEVRVGGSIASREVVPSGQ